MALKSRDLLLLLLMTSTYLGLTQGLFCRICNTAVDDFCKKPGPDCPGWGRQLLMDMTEKCTNKHGVFYDCNNQGQIYQDWHTLFGFVSEPHTLMSRDEPDLCGPQAPPGGGNGSEIPCVLQANRLVNAKTMNETYDVCVTLKLTIPKQGSGDPGAAPISELITSPRIYRFCGYKHAVYTNPKDGYTVTRSAINRTKMECHQPPSSPGIVAETCYCDKDKCNGGNMMALPVWLLILHQTASYLLH